MKRTKFCSHMGPVDQRQQDRGQGELILVHQPADHAEQDADTDVKHVLVDGKRTQQGHDQDNRIQHALLQRNDLREHAHARAAQSAASRGLLASARQRPCTPRKPGDITSRTGLDALHDEGAEQDGPDGAARYAEGEQRDHCAAGAAVIGRPADATPFGIPAPHSPGACWHPC